MKLAGVPFRIGREATASSAQRGHGGLAEQEDNAGVQQRQLPLGLHLDPYRVPGDAASGPSRSLSRDRIRCPKPVRATRA